MNRLLGWLKHVKCVHLSIEFRPQRIRSNMTEWDGMKYYKKILKNDTELVSGVFIESKGWASVWFSKWQGQRQQSYYSSEKYFEQRIPIHGKGTCNLQLHFSHAHSARGLKKYIYRLFTDLINYSNWVELNLSRNQIWEWYNWFIWLEISSAIELAKLNEFHC